MKMNAKNIVCEVCKIDVALMKAEGKLLCLNCARTRAGELKSTAESIVGF